MDILIHVHHLQYLACQYCTRSSEPLYIANTFSFHSGFHGFEAGSCEKIFINMSTCSTMINLSCELDVAEASEKLFDCVVRDGVRSAQVGEGLVLDRNQKIPEVRQVKSKLEFKGFMLRTHLNSSARRDLTVLTYCFLSLGLIATRAWMSQTASNLVATTSEVRARKSHWYRRIRPSLD